MNIKTPIVAWLSGIAALILVLALNGGFQNEMIFTVMGILFATLLLGFFFSRRAKRDDDSSKDL